MTPVANPRMLAFVSAVAYRFSACERQVTGPTVRIQTGSAHSRARHGELSEASSGDIAAKVGNLAMEPSS
jgi:hypothetical protein